MSIASINKIVFFTLEQQAKKLGCNIQTHYGWNIFNNESVDNQTKYLLKRYALNRFGWPITETNEETNMEFATKDQKTMAEFLDEANEQKLDIFDENDFVKFFGQTFKRYLEQKKDSIIELMRIFDDFSNLAFARSIMNREISEFDQDASDMVADELQNLIMSDDFEVVDTPSTV